MNMLAHLRAYFGGHPAPPPTPYVAQYVLGPSILATFPIDISHYPGLVSFYFVVPEHGPMRVVTCWATKEHFVRDGARFCSQISATLDPLHGFIQDFTIESTSLWQRIPVYSAVITIVAFLGALKALFDYYDWIFSKPDLALTSDNIRIDVVQGAELKIMPLLVNNLPVAHREIELSAQLTSTAGASAKLEVHPPRIPNMPGATAQKITVTGIAPTHGEYKLMLFAAAQAGRLRDAQTFRLDTDVTVWPKIPNGKISSGSEKGSMGLLKGTVAVGAAAPNGLDCELEIKDSPGLRYDGIFEFYFLDKAPLWKTNESAGNEFAIFRWSTLKIPAYQNIPFQIGLISAPETDWRKVSRHANVACHYRKDKT